MPTPIAQGDSLRRNSRRARPREVTSRECIAPKRYARRDREGRLREFRADMRARVLARSLQYLLP